jgi:hypothetical protein
LSAREKLNAAHFHGALIIAAIVALLFDRWAVFRVAAAVLLATSVHSGDIRLTGRRC